MTVQELYEWLSEELRIRPAFGMSQVIIVTDDEEEIPSGVLDVECDGTHCVLRVDP